MNFEDLKLRVRMAIDNLYARDSKLLELDASEWALAHRLAVYLEIEIPGWNVDCEYDRQGEHLAVKTNAATVGRTGRTRPDIILHHRGELPQEHNLLVVELKKAEDAADWTKVKEFTAPPVGRREYQYEYGVAVSFLPGLELRWYANGTEMR